MADPAAATVPTPAPGAPAPVTPVPDPGAALPAPAPAPAPPAAPAAPAPAAPAAPAPAAPEAPAEGEAATDKSIADAMAEGFREHGLPVEGDPPAPPDPAAVAAAAEASIRAAAPPVPGAPAAPAAPGVAPPAPVAPGAPAAPGAAPAAPGAAPAAPGAAPAAPGAPAAPLKLLTDEELARPEEYGEGATGKAKSHGERWSRLTSGYKELQGAFEALRTESARAEQVRLETAPDAHFGAMLRDAYGEVGATEDQVRSTVGYIGLVNSRDPAQLRQAREWMAGELQALDAALGQAGTGNDPLSRHEDLQREVQAGDLTKERAEELAIAREQSAMLRGREEHRETATREHEAASVALRYGVESVNNLEETLRAQDPWFAHIMPHMEQAMAEVSRTAHPSTWDQHFAATYRGIRNGLISRHQAGGTAPAPAAPALPAPGAPAATVVHDPRLTAPATPDPLRTGAGGNPPALEPKTVSEAVTKGFQDFGLPVAGLVG